MDRDDLTQCRLCLDVLKEPRQLPCFHSFCLKCLQNSDLYDGDEIQCSTCASSFRVDNENLSTLKVDRFVERLVLETKSKLEDSCYERFCDNHPSAKINFFCVDCEVSGCPICSTGKHDNHRCIDLNEMGIVIRGELKNMSKDLKASLSWMNVQFCKEKQMEEERLKRFSEVSKEIVERGEFIKRSVDKQIENLLKQVEAVKKRCSKENEMFVKKSSNLMENVFQNFILYIDKLAVFGLPEELIESVRIVKSRTDDLKLMRIGSCSTDKPEVNFNLSSIHVDTLSLVGHIDITNSKKSLETAKKDLMVGNFQDSSNALATTSDIDDAHNNYIQTSSQKSPTKVSLRKVPECKLVHSIKVGRNVAAVTAGMNEVFISIEHTGDILRYCSKTFNKIKPDIQLEGLETPWDMTSIENEEMLTTHLFVVDNLQGKLFQVNIPHNPKTESSKFVKKTWNLGLSESVTLSSSRDRLLLASTANKIIEYSLSALLIASLSSPPSTSSTETSPPLQLPEPVGSFSVIPHMTDILHASHVAGDKYVVFFDHLYSLSGGFLVNNWGKMISSFGEGRGKIPSLQLDYPSHVVVDRKMNAHVVDDVVYSDDLKDDCRASHCGGKPYNDVAFIFLCDNGNDRITLFDGDLKYLKVAVEKVEEPWRVAIDQSENKLFVATLQQSVKVFSY